MKLGRRPSFKRTSPMLQHPSPATMTISYQKWSWAEGPASQGQVQCSNIHKSNAPTSKSRNNNDFLSKMTLGRRPSFKRTSPTLQHPSPKTSLNQQTMSVYERPASMKNWRQKQCYRRTVPSIVKEFENEVSNVPSPKSRNIVICH